MNIFIIPLILLLFGWGGYGFCSGNRLLGGGAGLLVVILVGILMNHWI